MANFISQMSTLEDAGMSRQQAKAVAVVMSEMVQDAVKSELEPIRGSIERPKTAVRVSPVPTPAADR